MNHRLLAAALLGFAAFSAHAQLKPGGSRGLDAPAALPSPRAPAAAASAPAAAPVQTENEKAGQLAASGWLTLIDRRDWGTSWETSAAQFRKAVPLDKWMEGAPKVRADLGAVQERIPDATSYKTELPGQPKGEYVTVVYVTKFAQRTVEEVVTTVKDSDGRWRVTGYATR